VPTAGNSMATIRDLFDDRVIMKAYGQLIPHTSRCVIFICAAA
jgi:hypothetical protein